MIIVLLLLAVALVGHYLYADYRRKQLESRLAEKSSEVDKLREATQAALARAQAAVAEQQAEIQQQAEHYHKHYEAETLQIAQKANVFIENMMAEYEPLRKYAGLNDAEAEARRVVAEAIAEANGMRADALLLLEQSRKFSFDERTQAVGKAKAIQEQAEARLAKAIRDAGSIVTEAHARAEQIAGDAYTALREKGQLEQAAKAIRNVIEGYGDRYLVPTRSLLDDLATDFGHTEAGQHLLAAREHSRRMVEEGQAATCDYAETTRRETAIRFAIDAFNGRVDAILSRTKHDNFGTLAQEIQDACSLVNLNGRAFRDARIQPAFLEARLAELKWAVIAQELRWKEREEQRRIKEQIREEEKARREYERAIREAEQEEARIKAALEKARLEAENATAQEKIRFETQIAALNLRLAEAEAKNQRALSMAQQTRKGNIYIISNIGSFGDGILKIGMTRRLEPMDRIWELGDASVPFDFDVHAIIPSEDAPALEALLHKQFDDLRINKVNFRKEFFYVNLERIREFVQTKGIEASFTITAEAHEYRETQAIQKMSPEERERYYRAKIE